MFLTAKSLFKTAIILIMSLGLFYLNSKPLDKGSEYGGMDEIEFIAASVTDCLWGAQSLKKNPNIGTFMCNCAQTTGERYTDCQGNVDPSQEE